jgi:diaphanous 1
MAHAKNCVVAIMLARLRMEHSAIRDAVLQIDDRKMTIDRLKPLKSFAPTAQEVCCSAYLSA